MTFREAVRQACAPVNDACQNGLQALGSHSTLIEDAQGIVRGSLDLDSALAQSMPQDCRWDYGIGFQSGHQEKAFWVEVHGARTSGVSEVLRKLSWLKDYLNHQGLSLRQLTSAKDPYVWIATGSGNHILKNSPQARALAKSGLKGPMKRFVLS
jgi:hypothetical protein